MNKTNTTDYVNGEIYDLDLDTVQLDPDQPKDNLGEDDVIDTITRSIVDHRFLQPVFFRLDEEGRPTLLLGGRRYVAARKAGLKTIPGIYNDRTQSGVHVVRNLLLKDLTPVQEAEALLQARAFGHSVAQLAKVLNKDETYVHSMLSILRLPDDILDICRDNPRYDRDIMLTVAQVEPENIMREMFTLFSRNMGGPEPRGTDRSKEGGARPIINKLAALAQYARNLDRKKDSDSLARLDQDLGQVLRASTTTPA